MRGKYDRLPKGPGASLTGFRRALNQTDKGITNTLPTQADHGQAEQSKGPAHWKHGPRPETTCHCEKHVLPTTWERIYRGAGESCGPNCQPTPTEEPQS